MSTPELVVAGNLNVDLVVGKVADWPGWGREVLVGHADRRPGGIAHAAFALAALGAPVAVVACVGDDDAGSYLVDALAAAGVNVSAARRVPGEATGLSLSVVRDDGERTFFTYQGALLAEAPDVLLGRTPDAPRWVLLSGLMLLPEAPAADVVQAMGRVRAVGGAVAVDPGWDPAGWPEARRQWAQAILRAADVALVNEDEARALGLLESPTAGAAGGLVAIKQGGRGATLVGGDGEHRIAGAAVEAVDTVGAGDVWNAAFLSRLRAGASPPQAAAYANAMGRRYVAGDVGPDRYPREG